MSTHTQYNNNSTTTTMRLPCIRQSAEFANWSTDHYCSAALNDWTRVFKTKDLQNCTVWMFNTLSITVLWRQNHFLQSTAVHKSSTLVYDLKQPDPPTPQKEKHDRWWTHSPAEKKPTKICIFIQFKKEIIKENRTKKRQFLDLLNKITLTVKLHKTYK